MPTEVLSPHFLPRVKQELRLRHYSPRTIGTYLACLRGYVDWLAPTAPRQALPHQPRSYLVRLVEYGASRSLLDQHVSAIKFVYVVLYGWPPERLDVPRPRKERRLPGVPTREEVIRLAEAIPNARHRLAVLLCYGSGLRVSELVNLDVGDVDMVNLLVRVRCGKGRKDRLTVLSSALIPALQAHMRGRSRVAPVFESQQGGRWSVRSMQHTVQRARIRSGIPTRVTPHSLRHAFATHLLESGTSLRAIQALLGHARVQTTVRYTRMTDPNRMRLVSPL